MDVGFVEFVIHWGFTSSAAFPLFYYDMSKAVSIHSADTITKLPAGSRGAVIVAGSHGGVYAAYLACKAGARAVILNDAGLGKDRAGIGGLDYCQQFGVAAATVGHDSARIGDAADMLTRGVISHANALARSCRCRPGMGCAQAAQRLTEAALSEAQPAPYQEARTILDIPGVRRAICVDSASLITAEDADCVVITGSHGGLLGGIKTAAVNAPVFAAIYNDAGIGIDEAGIARLGALDERGIAAATVAAASARIGDGLSSYGDGVLSAVNRRAGGFGGCVGMACRVFVERLVSL